MAAATAENARNTQSYGTVLRDLAHSATELVHSELALAKAEFRESIKRAANHTAQGAVFGALVALSAIPFMAFLVIGLGELLDGRYWLSSLIVAVLFGVGGGYMAWLSYQNLKQEDFSLPRARRGLERQRDAVQEKVEEIKTTIRGETYEPERI